MAIRRPGEMRYDHYGSQHLSVATSSSSRSNSPPSPIPPPSEIMDPIYNSLNTFGISYPATFFEPYPSNQPLEPQPHYGHTQSHPHSQSHSPAQMMQITLPSTSIQPNFVSPQDLHLAYQQMHSNSYISLDPTPDMDFGLTQSFSMAPSYEPVKQEPAQHQHEQTFLLNDELRPISGSMSSLDLPKRKGDRALARLHRSALDPDRHWACTQCIQKFARKSDLTRHLKRHAGLKDYPCTAPDCPLPPEERGFFRADARRRHWSKSPTCEIAFYKTPEGIAWSKKNGNRRGVVICRDDDHDAPSDDSESSYFE